MDLLTWSLTIVSPAIGSFARLAADRLRSDHPLGWSRSVCDQCGRQLKAHEVVPLFSWMWQRGRARCCNGVLRAAHPAAEFLALAGTIWAISVTEGPVQPISVLLWWCLLSLSIIDLTTFRLPDAVTLPLIVAGLALAAAGLTGAVWMHALGAAVGYFSFAAIGWAYWRFRGIEALGLGDAKLLAAAGAWLGVMALPSVLLWACATGMTQAVFGAIFRGMETMQRPIPFGPGLALGIWLTWLYGPMVLRAS